MAAFFRFTRPSIAVGLRVSLAVARCVGALDGLGLATLVRGAVLSYTVIVMVLVGTKNAAADGADV